MIKVCSKCGEEKDINKYCVCDECKKEHRKQYKEKNKEAIKAKNAEYYILNKEKINKRNINYYYLNKEDVLNQIKKYKNENKGKISKNYKIYYEKNKERLIPIRKKYYENNKEEYLEKSKEYYQNNKDKHKESVKNWMKEHKEEYNKYRRQKVSEDRKLRPYFYAWRDVLKGTLKRLGKKKEGHTIDILGYSALDLKEHIEKLFLPEMSWDNYGLWQIDHIKEVCTFDKNTPQNIVNALSNLQPLWKEDNLNKWFELKKKLNNYGI